MRAERAANRAPQFLSSCVRLAVLAIRKVTSLLAKRRAKFGKCGARRWHSLHNNSPEYDQQNCFAFAGKADPDECVKVRYVEPIVLLVSRKGGGNRVGDDTSKPSRIPVRKVKDFASNS